MKRICTIYRSAKHEGMYLYVDKQEDLTPVPEALLKQMGKLEFAMSLLLDSERKLAQADAAKVLAEIQDNGFYLQLPPRPGATHTPQHGEKIQSQ